MLYPPNDVKVFELDQILKNQRVVLQGKDNQINRYVPKVLKECVNRLMQLLHVDPGESTDFNPKAIDLEDSVLTPFRRIEKFDASRDPDGFSPAKNREKFVSKERAKSKLNNDLHNDSSSVLIRNESAMSMVVAPLDAS